MKVTTLFLFLTLAVPPSLFSLVNSQSLISSSVSSTVTHIAVSANGVFVSTANQVHRFSSTLQQLGDPLGSLGGTVNGIALLMILLIELLYSTNFKLNVF